VLRLYNFEKKTVFEEKLAALLLLVSENLRSFWFDEKKFVFEKKNNNV